MSASKRGPIDMDSRLRGNDGSRSTSPLISVTERGPIDMDSRLRGNDGSRSASARQREVSVVPLRPPERTSPTTSRAKVDRSPCLGAIIFRIASASLDFRTVQRSKGIQLRPRVDSLAALIDDLHGKRIDLKRLALENVLMPQWVERKHLGRAPDFAGPQRTAELQIGDRRL